MTPLRQGAVSAQRLVSQTTKVTTPSRAIPASASTINASRLPTRQLSSTPSSRAAHGDSHEGGHESHYDPPTGWLWGQDPKKKYEKEGWESIWYWGFYGSLVATAVAYAWKPDTSIETWALEEAKRRLQQEGTLPEDK